jgi:NAD(P)-dependent dehydrogenase (short-subunit alcohol dehydrogenase family)
MDLGLRGAAVCVSGGSKGMGREAALAFAREGARVAVSARGGEALEQTVAALRAAGSPDAFGVRTDVCDPQSIESLFEQIDGRWGGLNTLINMVGPTDPSRGVNFAEVPDEQWQYYFDVGVMSVVRCTRAALPLMRKAGWGRVINISSTSARLGLPFEAPYMTAKGGLNALSKNMAWALAREGILVNTLTPGVFQTEALRTYMAATDAKSQYSPDNLSDVWAWMVHTMQAGRHAGAIGRVALADEACSILLLLGSRANSYIVGANISIDGGTDYSPG